MSIELYLYIAIVCILWFITINLAKFLLKIEDTDEYEYYIELRLISYHHNVIVAETNNYRHELFHVPDKNGEWEKFVLKHAGRLTKFYYDITYRGIFFITITSELRNIVLIDENSKPQ